MSPKDPSLYPLFDRQGVEESRSIKPMWRTLLLIAFLLFIADVATRRIAFDIFGGIAKIRKGWTNWRTGQRPAPQADAKATLSALKKVVRKDGSEQSAPAQTQNQPQEAQPRNHSPMAAPLPKPKSDRKFEADPSVSAPTGALNDAIGGAGNVKPDSGPQVNVPGQQQPDQGPTTNRLLAAKKRAQDRMSDNQEKK